MILSISKNKIFEVGDVDQKIEQAKIIMNENVFGILILKSWLWNWISAILVPESIQKDYTGYANSKYFQELKLRKAKQFIGWYFSFR